MTTRIRDGVITLAIALLFAAPTASAVRFPRTIAGTADPGGGGFAQLIDGQGAIDIYLDEMLMTNVDLDSFPAYTEYVFQVGLIPTSVHQGNNADLNELLGVEIVYTGGSAGMAYPVVGSTRHTDKSVTITDLLGGVDSLVIYTKDGDVNGDGYIRVGYGSEISDPALYGAGDWQAGSAYFAAQVSDPLLTGASISVTTTIIPEPSTALLLGLGLVGIAAVRRRKAQ